MPKVADLLIHYSSEAGEAGQALEGPNEELGASLVDEVSFSGAETAAGLVDNSQRSGDIAEELDALADRAVELEKSAELAGSDAEVRTVEVSTEALVREFDTTLRAYGLNNVWNAYSCEASEPASAKLKGVARDARHYATIARKMSDEMGDLSTEGGIMKVLGMHKMRLGKARAALTNAEQRLGSNIANLKDHPREIKHSGIGRFLMREMTVVDNLPVAIKAESEWLHRAHDSIGKAIQVITAAAAKLAANPDAKLTDVINQGQLSAIRGLVTTQGHLMGNHSVVIDRDEQLIPLYKRVDEFKSTGTTKALTVVWSIASMAAFRHVGMTLLALGGAATGMAIPVTAAAVGYGLAIARSGKGILDNASTAKSACGAGDLLKVMHDVREYSKFTDTSVDMDHISDALDEMYSSHPQTKPVLKELEHALYNIVVLSEIIYDQALYTTLRMALVADAVS